jgi:O-antigen/teichoic acid export membrane protein
MGNVNVKNNSIFSFLSITSRLISNVLIFWFLARYFGADIFGKFSYAHTLSTVFILLADFGFDLLLITEIAKNKSNAKKVFQKYLWIKITLVFSALILMWTFVTVRSIDNTSLILGFLFGLYMLFNTITNFFIALFKGFEKFNLETKVSLAMNLFLLIVTVILAVLRLNIFTMAGAFVLSRVLGLLYSIKLANSVLPGISFGFVFEEMNETIKNTFVYGILIVSSSLLFQLDTLILGVFKSDSEVGVYQAVVRIILLPLIIPNIINNALLPTLARLNVEDKGKWVYICKILFKFLSWISLPMALILFVYPDEIIRIVYSSKDYSASIPILRVFSIILLFRFVADYLGIVLTTSNRQKTQMVVCVSGIIFNLILNFIVIPKYGAYGAGIVSLATVLYVTISYFIINSRMYLSWILNIKYLLLIIISIIIAVVFYTFDAINVFMGAPAIIILFAVFALYYFFTPEEKKMFFSWQVSLKMFKEE